MPRKKNSVFKMSILDYSVRLGFLFLILFVGHSHKRKSAYRLERFHSLQGSSISVPSGMPVYSSLPLSKLTGSKNGWPKPQLSS